MFYYSKDVNKKQQPNMRILNMTSHAWDMKQIEKEGDMEALIMMIRMIANLMTI